MFNCAQRRGAHAHADFALQHIGYQRHIAKVRQKPRPRFVVRMADQISGLHGLAGQFTTAGHSLFLAILRPMRWLVPGRAEKADARVFHCAGWDEMSLRLGSGRRQGRATENPRQNPKSLISKQLSPEVAVVGSLRAVALEEQYRGVAPLHMQDDGARNGKRQG